MVSSVYDPLGFLAPLLLVGKGLLQELCRGKVAWDDPIPENVRSCWLRWKHNWIWPVLVRSFGRQQRSDPLLPDYG